ncbi:mitochondrial ribosome recycling factor 1 isoform X2 [Nomia melanderi]
MDVLLKSNMNLNPQQEGTVLYLPIPKVTKEHREKLAKTAKAYFMKSKDKFTDVRNKYIKKVKGKENASSELIFRVETYISNLSREYISNAEKLLEAKQKELRGES